MMNKNERKELFENMAPIKKFAVLAGVFSALIFLAAILLIGPILLCFVFNTGWPLFLYAITAGVFATVAFMEENDLF